jgi:4-amino-4-deoxy-L-arabinose transferase-like glycosyltransferase
VADGKDVPLSAPAWIERRASWILALVVLVAAGLRFWALGTSPPGMHPDAASNAWNARCLLATGRDWSGTPWPLLTSRGFGQGQSTLYYYLLMPFQALGGMTPATTTLPSAVTGTLSILLLCLAGARLFGKTAGLLAAMVAAIAPWHIFLSRWGHESGIVPFLTAAPLALLVAAHLPFSEREPDRARSGAALAAGTAVGFACYGYLAMRVFWPVALVVAAAANARGFLAFATDRRGRRALGAFVLGLLVTLGPLAWRHLTDPTIGKRAREFTSWSEDDPFGTRFAKVAARYPGTLGPDFLFVHGDRFGIHALPDSGPLRGYVAPLLLAGLVAAVARLRRSAAARTLVALLLAYPFADALARHDGPHLLRAAPGIVPLALLAGLGGAAAWTWLASRRRWMALGAATLLGAWCAVSTARFASTYYGAYNRNVDTWQYFNADLLEAISWVKPRFADADALYVSMSVSSAMDQPFVLALVGLDYDPKVWFQQRPEMLRREDTDVVRSVGKIHFLFDAHDAETLRGLATNTRKDRVLIIARPGEWKRGEPAHTVFLPDGRPSFLIYDVSL